MVCSKKKRGRPAKRAKTHKESKRRYIEGLKEAGKKTY
jgi:hypothetical protein